MTDFTGRDALLEPCGGVVVVAHRENADWTPLKVALGRPLRPLLS